MSLVLPAGCTLPAVDEACARAWLGAVHAVARGTAYAVSGVLQAPGPGRNYYSVELRDDEVIQLRLNVPLRWVAAVRDLQRLDASFCEVPGAAAFLQAGFVVPDDLNSPVRAEHLAQLSPAERADVDYHQPPSLGHVVFNWFD